MSLSLSRWPARLVCSLVFLSALAAPGNAQGIISTIAGNGNAGGVIGGASLSATSVPLNYPIGVAVDAAGNVYIADQGNGAVYQVTPAGIISLFQGGGTGGVAVDAAGTVYFANQNTNQVFKTTPLGITSTSQVAGNGNAGFSGDGGPAASAALNSPIGVAVDAFGNVYIADQNNNRIRKVNTAGIISTFAGNGTAGFSGDGGPATHAELSSPFGVAADAAGNVYFTDVNNFRVRKVTPAGIISTFAGNGISGFNGDGGPATSAQLNTQGGLAVDAAGNVYIADWANFRIRMVNTAGIISTIAGNGKFGFSGDGGPATSAMLNYPIAVAVDAVEDVYIADQSNQRIRKVTPPSTAPTITSPLTASGTVGTPFFYQITATGFQTSFSTTMLPAGLSVNASGLISGTPTGAGTTNVTLTATNSGGTGTATLVLTINPATPVISSALTASGTVGTAFSYQITATNNPTSFGASGLPAGLSVNTTTGLISGTPTAPGMTNVTLTATGSSGTVTATLVLTINSAAPPVISSLSPNSTPAGGPAFSLTVNGSGFVSGSTV